METVPHDPGATGVVLSGGGARGAYEAGVVGGIVEILQRRSLTRAPFSIFTGTSVGAINAAWLAAHADTPDMNVSGLLNRWRGLELRQHLRVKPMRFLWPSRSGERLGRSLIDPRPLEELVHSGIPFDRLHRNLDSGLVRAVVIAALDIATAQTTMFAELAPGVEFIPSRDPRRRRSVTQIECAHVLASAAIPLLFPARQIGTRYYCDGGLRFNTPLAQAIRAGASRLVVVSALHDGPSHDVAASQRLRREADYPSLLFIMGKVLNALLLDPIDYDLRVMQRFNQLWSVLEETLAPTEMNRVRQVVQQARGLSYKHVDALEFHPSEDIGDITTRHAKRLSPKSLPAALVRLDSRFRDEFQHDLLSFVLFDGRFAEELIALGRHDAHQRADAVLDFFSCASSEPRRLHDR